MAQHDKESTCQCRRCWFDPWVRKFPWRRKWPPTPVFLPGKSHRQRNLVCYSPWDRKETDMTECNNKQTLSQPNVWPHIKYQTGSQPLGASTRGSGYDVEGVRGGKTNSYLWLNICDMHPHAWLLHFCCMNTWIFMYLSYSSVQFSCSVMSDSLWPHGLQHARLPCPSPTPRTCSNSCPSHPLLSSSPPAFNLPQHQGLFQWVGSSHQVTKVLEFQI